MEVFVSWSGELSKLVAEQIKKWLPTIIQSVRVFYSSDDIEKGDNWDSKISSELSKCNFGIICLTNENIMAPWIHFEAGALAKSLDSKVTALMIGVVPSDIKGPLSRYQATKLEKDDFYKLVQEINKNTESPLESEVLKNAFDVIWEQMYPTINDIISKKNNKIVEKKEKVEENKIVNETLEEILQLVRKQDVKLGDPEVLLPEKYVTSIMERLSTNRIRKEDIEVFIRKIYMEMRKSNSYTRKESDIPESVKNNYFMYYSRIFDLLIDIIKKFRLDRQLYDDIRRYSYRTFEDERQMHFTDNEVASQTVYMMD